MALLQEEFTSLFDDVDLDRDRVLVERCQAGDSAAFGNLYARYYDRLLRFCLRRLNDRHEAEDAAQEAFARAWKALPRFAGERRFYPWLTVIAGNICTDMLRRRNRSTPTDDLELGAHQQVGGGSVDTSEELVLAAVDGELVNKALGRLSSRHREVLAMREGSGWTYQQIAEHEGVEIGTIETLLWRARQALKREFTVLSESKGMLGGFLAGAGILLKRGFLRVAHKGASLGQSGGGGTIRNAMAGVAFTSAAVAAAFIAPHALSGSAPKAQALSSATNAASPMLFPSSHASPLADASSTGPGVAGGSLPSAATDPSGLLGSGSIGSTGIDGVTGTGGLPTIPGAQGLSNLLGGSGSDSFAGAAKVTGSAVSGLASGAGSVTSGATNAASSAVGDVTQALGSAVSGLGSTGAGTPGAGTPTSTTIPPVIAPVVNSLNLPPATAILGGI